MNSSDRTEKRRAEAKREKQRVREKRQRGEGIGWNGKTLREQIAQLEDKTAATGHYCGLSELALKEEDPIRFEQLYSRLRGDLVTARETSKEVSATPIVEQEGELCYGLFTPEGDSIAVSTGIIVHVHTMSEAIKFMINHDYEENPGIEPGDVFVNNDPHVGDVHPCDLMTIIPIFHEGELVAWVGGVNHVIDTGAIGPGSMNVSQASRFGDGAYYTARKIGENFELYNSWKKEYPAKTRTPNFLKLDERTRMTGCLMIRHSVKEMIAKHGVDTFKQLSREAVEDGRRGFRSRIKRTMLPGTYRGVSFVDALYEGQENVTREYANENHLMHAPSELHVREDGTFQVSFEGANKWGWHPFNCTPAAIQGGIWVMLTQTVIPNELVNDGAYYACDFHLPVGSWANTQNTETAHAYAWHFLVSAWAPLWQHLSRGYFARGFWEEINAGNANTSNWLQGGGIDQFDKLHAVNSFESACEGVGARYVEDGEPHASAIWNPEGDMGDAEAWERVEPLPFLGRAVKPNTGGVGRRAGGAGFESMRTVKDVSRWLLYEMGNGYMTSDGGLFGGYPAASGYILNARNTDLEERFENGEEYPQHDLDPESGEFESKIDGEITRRPEGISTPKEFDDYDMYLNYLRGGSGLGDPLEREPEKVLEDIHDGYVLPRHAKDAYAVVVENVDDEAQHNSAVQGEWELDEEATERLREQRMQERTEKAQPVSEWYDEERERIRDEEGLIDDVKKTYVSSMRMSKQFATFFRRFWDLPAEFEFELSEKAQRSLDNRFDSGLRPMWDSPTLGHETWLDVEDEPYVPYTWTDRSIRDLPGPASTFRDRERAADDD
ncbi:hydantoinase B/oxoprolinase family protein [Natrialbaceae archaeon AArc-T1-2]|uniref:hydantoinase B/oxoprolinase family protein n=1 Tax=Natrialbaceae archaeon AArc-T1-2 TaxID=3053904 RepID=UPI00255A8608|nr:hydantoinase B/oxoprolinase family protein [Natrialbaceae archaeon AArc-T1-2]WIV68021.1 hydantoinase B/oxoprolinase family protein [Natrialbaceae archaeon AArc-T1-2]